MQAHVSACAEELENYLGSPLDPEGGLSFKRVMESDEAEEFPEAALAQLRNHRLGQYLVPNEWGGRLRFDDMFHMTRVLARRDLSVAIANGTTFLGSVFVWIAGSEAQKKRVAELLGRGALAALALTEEAHGSDVIATEFTAKTLSDGALSLSGTKWFINNCSRSAALSLFAKMDDGNLAILFVDKEAIDPSTYSYLPKFHTMGVRALDICGIRFEGTRLASDCVIGKPERGMQTLMTGLYVTRAMCAPLSLGVGDTALRSTVAFAVNRRLYGDSVFQIPTAQSTLVDAFLDLMACDCVGLTAARGIHFAPDQMSVAAAVTKYLVPTTMDAMVRSVAVVLGARYHSREAHWWGIFQKMVRDASIVPLFDGSTAVNLYVLGIQLAALAEQRKKTGSAKNAPQILEPWFALDQAVADWRPELLRASNQGIDLVVQGLPALVEEVASLASSAPGNEPLAAVARSTRALQSEVERHEHLLENIGISDRRELLKSPELVEAAKRYCVLYGAAATLRMWCANRAKLGDFFADGRWLVLCLNRWLAWLNPNRAERLPKGWRDAMATELRRRYEQDIMFSIVPSRIARSHT